MKVSKILATILPLIIAFENKEALGSSTNPPLNPTQYAAVPISQLSSEELNLLKLKCKSNLERARHAYRTYVYPSAKKPGQGTRISEDSHVNGSRMESHHAVKNIFGSGGSPKARKCFQDSQSQETEANTAYTTLNRILDALNNSSSETALKLKADTQEVMNKYAAAYETIFSSDDTCSNGKEKSGNGRTSAAYRYHDSDLEGFIWRDDAGSGTSDVDLSVSARDIGVTADRNGDWLNYRTLEELKAATKIRNFIAKQVAKRNMQVGEQKKRINRSYDTGKAEQ